MCDLIKERKEIHEGYEKAHKKKLNWYKTDRKLWLSKIYLVKKTINTCTRNLFSAFDFFFLIKNQYFFTLFLFIIAVKLKKSWSSVGNADSVWPISKRTEYIEIRANEIHTQHFVQNED